MSAIDLLVRYHDYANTRIGQASDLTEVCVFSKTQDANMFLSYSQARIKV